MTSTSSRDGILIVNADDLGYQASVNAAIIQCFERGLCSSATIMANMPGFEEACELVHRHGLSEHIGVHLNLAEGEPLTPGIKGSRLSGACGRFSLVRLRRILWLGGAEKRLLADEIRAQVARCRRQGLRLTHLDSHGHLHEEWAIGLIVRRLAHELRIPYVRIALTFTDKRKVLQRAYRRLYNGQLRKDGLARTSCFGGPQHYLAALARGQDVWRRDCEIMLHPTLTEEGEVVDPLWGRPVGEIASLIPGVGRIVSFGGRRPGERSAGRAAANSGSCHAVR